MPNFDITISPAQIEYLLKPGITITQAYEITNNSSQNIYLNTELLPFIPQGNDGSVIYKNIVSNPDINFSLANSNIKLNQPFLLPPHSKQQLVLKVKSSPNVNLSDSYYTFFVYQQLPSTRFTQTTGRIGSHILLTLTDKENLDNAGEITNFSLKPKIKDVLFTKLTFKSELKNNSNHFFKTNGKLTLTKNNKIIKELNLQPNNVLNNHYRQINCQNQSSCIIEGPFWPGKYIATLELDSNLNVPSVSTSFFIFPISPLLLILFIVTLSLSFKYLKKKLKKIFKKT